MKLNHLAFFTVFAWSAAHCLGQATNAMTLKSFPNGIGLLLWEERREVAAPRPDIVMVNIEMRLTLTNSRSGHSHVLMEQKIVEYPQLQKPAFSFFDANLCQTNLYVLFRQYSATKVGRWSLAEPQKTPDTNAFVELWKDAQADGQVATRGRIVVTNSLVAVALEVDNLGERRWIQDGLTWRDVSTNNPNLKTYVPYPSQ